MYIWKINKLNDELKAGRLSEVEAFKYLMANTVVFSIAAMPYMEPNQYDLYASIIGGAIGIAGLWFIYIVNGGKNGTNIIERYVSIGWVVLVRMLALFVLPVIVTVMAYQEIYLGAVPEETTLIEFISTLIFEVVYILLVAKHINRVARDLNA